MNPGMAKTNLIKIPSVFPAEPESFNKKSILLKISKKGLNS